MHLAGLDRQVDAVQRADPGKHLDDSAHRQQRRIGVAGHRILPALGERLIRGADGHGRDYRRTSVRRQAKVATQLSLLRPPAVSKLCVVDLPTVTTEVSDTPTGAGSGAAVGGGALLQLLRRDGPSTRAELAGRTGLARSTVALRVHDGW